MKKLLAVFCAITLMPMYSAQAWIGGPFSGNSYFGQGGDDGVYEAAASGFNGIGLFRFVVGNEFAGSQTSTAGVNSGNIIFGAIGSSRSVWFYEGVAYLTGNCIGTVNSNLGIAQAAAISTNGLDSIESGFSATLARYGDWIVASSFFGSGEFQPYDNGTPIGGPLPFRVSGSRVSQNILFGL